METLAIWLAFTFAGLIVSARTRVNVPVLGPTPVLGLLVLAAILILAGAVLLLARSVIREGGIRLRFGTVTA